jgi:putative transposase
MKFRFIDEQRGYHSVEKMAGLLAVSRGGYYAWRHRAKSTRASEDERLVERIKEIQERVKHRYGSPRITEALGRAGCSVGHNRVARLMREHELGRRPRKRYRSTTNSAHSHPVAENLVNREFEVPEMNRVWSSDITYVATAEGWLYLCVVIDLYSRKVVGWAMKATMQAGLVVEALRMALMRRRWPGGVIFHSDRGSQYASEMVRLRLQQHGLVQSMSRKGNCWDNAPTESFFSTLKNELCGEAAFITRTQAQEEIFEYIEIFYNRIRLHSTLGYLSPAEYEEAGERKAS